MNPGDDSWGAPEGWTEREIKSMNTLRRIRTSKP